MCSARNRIALAMLTLAVGIGGCQWANQPGKNKLSTAPIHDDEAMNLREWPKRDATYAPGYVIADPTLFPFAPRSENVSAGEPFATAPVIFYANAVLMPFTFIATPSWEDIYYRGVETPPTYTAVPAAPNDASYFTDFKWKVRHKAPARRPTTRSAS